MWGDDCGGGGFLDYGGSGEGAFRPQSLSVVSGGRVEAVFDQDGCGFGGSVGGIIGLVIGLEKRPTHVTQGGDS